jgi:hypothetical protein
MRIGTKLYLLTFIEDLGYDKNRKYKKGIFKCDCGAVVEKRISHVSSGITKSCGYKCPKFIRNTHSIAEKNHIIKRKELTEKLILDVDNKLCTRCLQILPYSSFFKSKYTKDGYNNCCKHCVKRTKARDIPTYKNEKLLCTSCGNYKEECEFGNHSYKIHRNCKDTKCKVCRKIDLEIKKERKVRKSDLWKIFKMRFKSTETRAKNKNLVLNFDINYLFDLWEKQNGLCALSNVKMSTLINAGKISTNVSIDRIDNKQGYTKDNIQLVCSVINQMKNDSLQDEFLDFCEKISDFNKLKNG